MQQVPHALCRNRACFGQTYCVRATSGLRCLDGDCDAADSAYIGKLVRVQRYLRFLFLVVRQQRETVSLSFEVATKYLNPSAEDINRPRPPLLAPIAPRVRDRRHLLEKHPGARCDLRMQAPDRTPLCQSNDAVIPKTQLRKLHSQQGRPLDEFTPPRLPYLSRHGNARRLARGQ